jgi:PAS domain S-box-containing protein
VPVRQADGEVGLSLAMVPSLEAFDALIRQHQPPSVWGIAVYDRQGIIVARTSNSDRYTGKPVAPSLLPLLQENDDGLAEAATLEGEPVLVAWNRVGLSGWGVGVAVPRAAIYGPLWRTLGITLAVFGLTLAAALALAALIAARIAAPVHALAQVGAKYAAGENVTSLGLREADAAAAQIVAATRERAAAEAARAAREVDFLEAQRVAHIGSWRWDPATDDMTASEETLRIFGFDPETESLPPFREHPGRLYPVASWEQINQAVACALETGRGYEIDVEGVRGETPIWVSIHGQAVRNADGMVVGLRGTVQDVTLRKQAELGLAESEERFRALATATQEGVVIHDGDHIMEANEAYWRMFGHASREDVVGRSPFEMVVPAARADASSKVSSRYAEPYETIGLRRDGSTFPIETHAHTIVYKGRRMRVGVIRDMTRQKAAEAALERLAVMAGQVRDPVLLVARDGRILEANAAAAAAYGHDREALLDLSVRDLRAAETQEIMAAQMAEANQGGVLFETLHRRADGSVFPAEVSSIGAGVLGQRVLVSVIRDITARKQAEEALRESEARLRELNHSLEIRVREEVAAREDAQTRAAHAQRMQALGQLAGGIAHDFNNVLQAAQGGLTLISNRSTDPAKVVKFATMALGAIDRGASITGRLLAFARRGELRAERIDPVGLLDGLRDILTQTLGSPISVRIKTDGSSLPALSADRGQLETVLVNLATNARDAMPDGGLLTFFAVAAEYAAGRSNPAGLSPGQYVQMSVSDTGTGMDKATLARAMEPFFTTKPQDKGTGLGLSMAKGFTEQSGGALAIDSTPGQGTTVTLWLPVAIEQQEPAQAQPGETPVVGLLRRILVVDDEHMVRETLVAALEDAGFSVLAAENGAEALALLEADEPVDVMVSDKSMPGMDGLALIRAAHQRRPDLPAILLTGFAGEASQLATGTAARNFSLLRKPVSIAQLVDRIEAVLSARARP